MDYYETYLLIRSLPGLCPDVVYIIARNYFERIPPTHLVPRWTVEKYLLAGCPAAQKQEIEQFLWLTHLHRWPARARQLQRRGRISKGCSKKFCAVFRAWATGNNRLEPGQQLTRHSQHYLRAYLAGLCTIEVFLERAAKNRREFTDHERLTNYLAVCGNKQVRRRISAALERLPTW